MPAALVESCTRAALAESVKEAVRRLRQAPYAQTFAVFADADGVYWCFAHGWREKRVREQLPRGHVGYYNRGVDPGELLEDVVFVAREQGWFSEE